MNKGLTHGLVFAIGGILGAGASFIFAKRKYEMKADQEIAQARADFNVKLEELENQCGDLIKKIGEINSKTKGNSPMEYIARSSNDDILEEEEEEIEEVDEPDEDDDEYFSQAKKKSDMIIKNIFDDYGSKSVSQNNSKPYVISPDEYGNNDEYNLETLYYTADGKIIDEANDEIDDIDGTIGYESLKHFGDYEEDALHVRNDTRMCDYEILLLLDTLEELKAK